MYQKLLIPLGIYIVLVVAQLTLVPLISIEFLHPNILIIFLVYLTLIYGQFYGTLAGFVMGFIFDIATGGLLGSNMFSFTLAGFSTGNFFNVNKIGHNTKSLIFVLFVFIAAFINAMTFSILSLSQSSLKFGFILFEGGLLPGLYTALVSSVVIIFKQSRIFHE